MDRNIANKINYRQFLRDKSKDLEKEIEKYLDEKYPDLFNFEWGESIGEIVDLSKIDKKIEDGQYDTKIHFFNKTCINDEYYSNGIIYVPITGDFYLEVFFEG